MPKNVLRYSPIVLLPLGQAVLPEGTVLTWPREEPGTSFQMSEVNERMKDLTYTTRRVLIIQKREQLISELSIWHLYSLF